MNSSDSMKINVIFPGNDSKLHGVFYSGNWIYAIGGSINDCPFKPVGTIEVLRLNELQNK